MNPGDIEWAEMIRLLGLGGIVFVTGFIIFVAKPQTSAFGFRGTEIGSFWMAIGVLGSAGLGWWAFKDTDKRNSHF